MDVFDVTDPSSATQSSTSSSPDRLRDPLNDDLTPSWLLSAVAAANEKASAAGQPSGTLSKLPIELITNILSCARAEYSLHSSMAHRCFFLSLCFSLQSCRPARSLPPLPPRAGCATRPAVAPSKRCSGTACAYRLDGSAKAGRASSSVPSVEPPRVPPAGCRRGLAPERGSRPMARLTLSSCTRARIWRDGGRSRRCHAQRPRVSHAARRTSLCF